MTKSRNFLNSRLNKRVALVGLVSILSISPLSGSLAADTAKGGFKEAWALYNNKNYVASADAFETLIKSAAPNGKLFYYATLANFYANRKGRARQLSQYLVANFPGTIESTYCRKLFPDLASSSGSSGSKADSSSGTITQLPPEILSKLPQEYQDGLRKGEMVAKKGPGNSFVVTSKDAHDEPTTASKIAALTGMKTTSSSQRSSASGVRGARPFTAADVARDGAAGIDQSQNPNCWFEASMAALAELPRGQRLMADMIRYGDKGSYIVRFPGDGNEYTITEEDLRNTVHNKAQWASIIEAAQLKKFPDNAGSNGKYDDESRLAVGLGCITGCKAEVVVPGSCDTAALSRFIGSAISSKNPIVCGTYPDSYTTSLPDLVIGQHAYSIIGFDASSQLITIRNPHGATSRRFALSSDPSHRKFQQMDDGVFKMHLTLFQQYFHSVCRSFI